MAATGNGNNYNFIIMAVKTSLPLTHPYLSKQMPGTATLVVIPRDWRRAQMPVNSSSVK